MNQNHREEFLSWLKFSGYRQKWVTQAAKNMGRKALSTIPRQRKDAVSYLLVFKAQSASMFTSRQDRTQTFASCQACQPMRPCPQSAVYMYTISIATFAVHFHFIWRSKSLFRGRKGCRHLHLVKHVNQCFHVLRVLSTCTRVNIATFAVHFLLYEEASLCLSDRLIGLVVKASASRMEDPGLNPTCAGIFSGSSHTSDLKIGTPVATLPSTWCYRVSAGTGWLVSVYCDWVRWRVWSATCISVFQHVKLSEQIRPWDTLACCWDIRQPSNQLCLSCTVPQYRESGIRADKGELIRVFCCSCVMIHCKWHAILVSSGWPCSEVMRNNSSVKLPKRLVFAFSI